MKLFSLLVLYKGDNQAHVLKAAFDLASFSFFQRYSLLLVFCMFLYEFFFNELGMSIPRNCTHQLPQN